MSGPRLSIVLSPGAAVQRLRLSVESALDSAARAGAPFELVIALADADEPSREVAQALDHPAVRLAIGSASDTRAAAELAWGETVILLRGDDLLSADYVARMAAVADEGAVTGGADGIGGAGGAAVLSTYRDWGRAV